jgi:type III pantothenate kinase
MLLAVDVGNTQTLAGVYQGDELLHEWRISTERAATADELAADHDQILRLRGGSLGALDSMVVSSVVPTLSAEYRSLSLKYLGQEVLMVGPGVRTGLQIAIDNPHELGADRIVNAVAAHVRWPQGAVVVDLGTATTFDVVTPRGEYAGGVIAPGLMVSADALFRATAKLPRVEIVRPKTTIGKNTVASMQAGLVFGYAGLVDAIVNRIRSEVDFQPHVVATGGLSELLARESSTIEDCDDLLTLRGLQILHERNRA